MLGCWTNEPGPSRRPPPPPSPPSLHPHSTPCAFPSPLQLPPSCFDLKTQGDTQGGDYDPILQMGKGEAREGWDLHPRHPLSYHLLPQWKSFSRLHDVVNSVA